MKVVIQRVKNASVSINNKLYNKINNGMLILVGFTDGDTSQDIDYIVKKVINLRVFDDESGVMNKSILDVGGSILSVSQFTLYADTRKGRRPSYVDAMSGDKAKALYDEFNEKLRNTGVKVETGIFGADMKVDFINDGPITIMLEK